MSLCSRVQVVWGYISKLVCIWYMVTIHHFKVFLLGFSMIYWPPDNSSRTPCFAHVNLGAWIEGFLGFFQKYRFFWGPPNSNITQRYLKITCFMNRPKLIQQKRYMGYRGQFSTQKKLFDPQNEPKLAPKFTGILALFMSLSSPKPCGPHISV